MPVKQNYKTPQLELAGHRSGKLVAIERYGVNHDKRILWRCKCDCGNETTATASALRLGLNKSCGCIGNSHKGRGHTGRTRLHEYKTWVAIRARCRSTDPDTFPFYGARGIKVAPEWDNTESGFELFFAHIGPRPSNRHSIDRVDNDRGYEPGNVRWATSKQQSANTRWAHKITINGETLCVSEWSRRSGVKVPTLFSRLARGVSLELLLSPAPLPRRASGRH